MNWEGLSKSAITVSCWLKNTCNLPVMSSVAYCVLSKFLFHVCNSVLKRCLNASAQIDMHLKYSSTSHVNKPFFVSFWYLLTNIFCLTISTLSTISLRSSSISCWNSLRHLILSLAQFKIEAGTSLLRFVTLWEYWSVRLMIDWMVSRLTS